MKCSNCGKDLDNDAACYAQRVAPFQCPTNCV